MLDLVSDGLTEGSCNHSTTLAVALWLHGSSSPGILQIDQCMQEILGGPEDSMIDSDRLEEPCGLGRVAMSAPGQRAIGANNGNGIRPERSEVPGDEAGRLSPGGWNLSLVSLACCWPPLGGSESHRDRWICTTTSYKGGGDPESSAAVPKQTNVRP